MDYHFGLMNTLMRGARAALVTTLLFAGCGEPINGGDSSSASDIGSDTSTPDSGSDTETTSDISDPACLDDPLVGGADPYPEGVEGVECSETAPCAGGGVCSAELFPSASGYTGTLCYPACASGGPSVPCCLAGDRCVELGQTRACLATGHARKEGLSLKLWPAGSTPDHTGVALVSVDVVVEGKKIPLNMAYAIEDSVDINGDGTEEQVIIIELEGVAGVLGTWVLQLTVPADRWAEGVLETERLNPEAGFDVVLTKWVGQKMTIEAISTTGTLTISAPGAPCAKVPCDKALVSFDVELVAIDAALGA